MWIAKTITVAFLVSIFCVSVSSATPEPPKGFRTLKWGAAPSGGLKKLMGPTSDGTSMYTPAPGKKLPPFFDIPVAEEGYSFTRGRFFSGSVWLDGQPNLEKMKTALSKEYGPPTFANEQSYIWKWKWPSKKIEVQLYYQSKFSRTTVTYLNNGI
jgi:hypothetical protein